MSAPSGATTNQTSPEPWPFVPPGPASPAKRYSGHLPAFSPQFAVLALNE